MSRHTRDAFALFNPALTAAVLASAAMDHRSQTGQGMPISLAFLIAPLVLHQPFQTALPGRANARLAGWLLANQAVRGDFPRICSAYVEITREGLRLGLRAGALQPDRDRLDGHLLPVPPDVSPDVLTALSKARLAGRWLGQASSPAIIYRLFGVRP